MSERDSVHTEIEKLQEKVEAREARIAQLERKAKEQEGEVRESTLVISIAFASDGLSNRFRYRVHSAKGCSFKSKSCGGAERRRRLRWTL